MFDKKNLSLCELQALFAARFRIYYAKERKLHARLQQALGYELDKELENNPIIETFHEWISALLARRLKNGERNGPLLSEGDLVRYLPLVLEQVTKLVGHKPEGKDLENFKAIWNARFETVFKMMRTIVRFGWDPSDEYWRWIATVVELATERGMPPVVLLELEEAMDEITRRMFTKEEFLRLNNQAMKSFFDIERWTRETLQPTITDLESRTLSKAERDSWRHEVKNQIPSRSDSSLRNRKTPHKHSAGRGGQPHLRNGTNLAPLPETSSLAYLPTANPCERFFNK